jgi:hypothetical protein
MEPEGSLPCLYDGALVPVMEHLNNGGSTIRSQGAEPHTQY